MEWSVVEFFGISEWHKEGRGLSPDSVVPRVFYEVLCGARVDAYEVHGGGQSVLVIFWCLNAQDQRILIRASYSFGFAKDIRILLLESVQLVGVWKPGLYKRDCTCMWKGTGSREVVVSTYSGNSFQRPCTQSWGFTLQLSWEQLFSPSLCTSNLREKIWFNFISSDPD